jgi:hypothetical protein
MKAAAMAFSAHCFHLAITFQTELGGEAKFPNIIEPYIAASFPATQLMYKHIVPYIAQQYPSDQALETAFQGEQKKQIERDYPASKD